MDENTNATMFTDEYEPLMPDGWAEGDDLFGTESEEPAEVETEGEPEEAPAEDEIANPDNSEPPTTAESEEPGAEDSEAAPTTEPESEIPAEHARLRFKARIDHEDKDVELDEADLPTIYQKAHATDRAQQRMKELQSVSDRAGEIARILGYDDPVKMFDEVAQQHREAEIEKLVDEGTAQSVAEFIVDQKMKAAGLAPQSAPASTPDSPPSAETIPAAAEAAQAQTPVQSAPAGQRDYSSEVMELLRARPQLVGKPLPDEVVNAATAGGKRLLDAYKEFEDAGARRETERLRKENSVLKQNAEAAKRAPVRGSSDGGKTDTEPSDPILKGFDADPW